MDNENQQPSEPQFPSPIHPPGNVITPDSGAVNQLAQPTVMPPPTPQNSPIGVPQSSINLAPVVSDHPQPISSAQQPVINMPRKSKLPILIGIALLVLLLIAGGAFALLSHNKTVTITKTYTGKLSNKEGSISGSVTAPVTTTVNCGSENCFATYFQKCNPATLTATSPIANVKYQIYGKKSNGCSMLFEYTSNPNAAWVNQPMTCNFDNSQSLDNSVTAVINDLTSQKNTYACTGPLVAILQNQ